MKKFRKLIPALAMLLVSAVLMSTASYAWFSMNTKVTVTGMQVTTKVGSNLLISPDTVEANFTTANTSSRTGILEPVSTIDGNSFFYTLDAKADGSKAQSTATVPFVAYNENDAYVEAENDANTALSAASKTNLDKEFNEAYGINAPTNVAFGYIDYTFFLKATSTQADQKLSLALCRLLYNGGVANDDAWRVAIFRTSGQATAELADGQTPTLLSILTPFGATNQEGSKAVSSTTGTATITSLGAAATLDADIDASVTRYYKVVARLYLEGEDKTCTNETYASLTSSFTLDLEFTLGSETGIVNISTSKADATASTNTATVKLNNGETATAWQWKNASDNSNIAGATAASWTNTGAATSVYCVVTTAEGSYTSNTVSVAAGS